MDRLSGPRPGLTHAPFEESGRAELPSLTLRGVPLLLPGAEPGSVLQNRSRVRPERLTGSQLSASFSSVPWAPLLSHPGPALLLLNPGVLISASSPGSFPSLPRRLQAQETKQKTAEIKGFGSGLQLDPRAPGVTGHGLSPRRGKVPWQPQTHAALSASISGDSTCLFPAKAQGVDFRGPPGLVSSGDGVP